MRKRHRPSIQPKVAAPPDAPRPWCRAFAAFYPQYLAEHRHPRNRQLHFIGSTLALVCLFFLVFTGNPWWLLAAAVCGYAFAWCGHFLVEHNRPATFSRPLFSLMADWVMWWQMLTGRLKPPAPTASEPVSSRARRR